MNESIEELLSRIEDRVIHLEHLAAQNDEHYEQMASDYAAALAFINDVWLNKYPTKPRVIAAAGRLLEKLGVR